MNINPKDSSYMIAIKLLSEQACPSVSPVFGDYSKADCIMRADKCIECWKEAIDRFKGDLADLPTKNHPLNIYDELNGE